jgi:hypothetical protein
MPNKNRARGFVCLPNVPKVIQSLGIGPGNIAGKKDRIAHTNPIKMRLFMAAISPAHSAYPQLERVPLPATGFLTDMQVRKICLVALAVLLIGGGFILPYFCAKDLISSLFVIVVSSVLSPGLVICMTYSHWPTADFQTPEGAAQIRSDLSLLSLGSLHSNYSFSDLSHYGYISDADAQAMLALYNQIPPTPDQAAEEFALERRQRSEQFCSWARTLRDINGQFEEIRSQPNFYVA